MEILGYPYHFVKRFDEPSSCSSNDFMRYRLLYSFRSSKSHQWYWVWVEAYEHDMYAVKFHLKAHRDSPNKYTIMTGLCEPRPVINTCVNIMLQIASTNPKASFGFVGAASPGEPEGPTNVSVFTVTLWPTILVTKSLCILETKRRAHTLC